MTNEQLAESGKEGRRKEGEQGRMRSAYFFFFFFFFLVVKMKGGWKGDGGEDFPLGGLGGRDSFSSSSSSSSSSFSSSTPIKGFDIGLISFPFYFPILPPNLLSPPQVTIDIY